MRPNLDLVFRGTLPWDMKNWIEDINFIKTSFPTCNNGCQVHRGFYHAYQEVAAQVIKAVKEYRLKYGITTVMYPNHYAE